MYPIELINEAKEFKRSMHKFEALASEHIADLSPTADQSYRIKLRAFIDDLEIVVYDNNEDIIH